MNKHEREKRILARGEVSGHCHVITGDVLIKEEKGSIILEVGKEGAILKHLLETPWVEEGKEVWTEEHTDINIKEGIYDYVPQINFDPLTQRIKNALD